ncbi:MAG: cobalt-precorrin 5A hydrolase [Nitrospinae bacterium]|nr:cobalt-precorrin 5A hydrolase [Nitrospinota bacterium]
MIVILYITDGGYHLSKRLLDLYPEAVLVKYSKEILPDIWKRHNRFVFIMATGIVVRAIANLLRDKETDPAVVVLDEKGRYAISLVSGHIGGANRLAKEIADFLGGDPVITTASDILNLPSLDIWALNNDLTIEDHGQALKKRSSLLVNKGDIRVYTEIPIDNPPDAFKLVALHSDADIIISNRYPHLPPFTSHLPPSASLTPILYLRPKNLVLGIGLRRGTTSKAIEDNIIDIFKENNLSIYSIRNLATIDKKRDEKGLIDFSGKFSIPIIFYTADELNQIDVDQPSPHVVKATGAMGVAEPAAILSSNNGRSLLKKIKRGDMTLAIREVSFRL